MTHITKPRVRHPGLQTNAIGLTRRDYEGSMSTLCAGCGHDSITAAIIQAAWAMSLEPHRVAKLSGIGCSLVDVGNAAVLPVMFRALCLSVHRFTPDSSSGRRFAATALFRGEVWGPSRKYQASGALFLV